MPPPPTPEEIAALRKRLGDRLQTDVYDEIRHPGDLFVAFEMLVIMAMALHVSLWNAAHKERPGDPLSPERFVPPEHDAMMRRQQMFYADSLRQVIQSVNPPVTLEALFPGSFTSHSLDLRTRQASPPMPRP
jgi:hypothetical protein